MDPVNGYFGYLTSENFVYSFIIMGVLCRSGTFIAYTFALFAYSIIIVTNAMMAEPMLSQILGVVAGIDNMPGLFTFVGMMITCMGIALLSLTLNK